MIVAYIIFFIIFLYLASTIVYLLWLAIAGRFGKLNRYTVNANRKKIAVMIPCYKEDAIILDTARNSRNQDYPSSLYSVFIIADGLLPETIASLAALDVTTIPVKFEKSSKAKSLNQAFSAIAGMGFELAVILDADNVMAPGVLEKINDAFQKGWKVVQCHRIAKNKNNSIAILDAASEEINNTIFRRGQRVAGLSCALIGSGMGFEFETIRSIFALPEIQNNPGEDREVDVQLVKLGLMVEYIEDALVFDEKVQKKEVFEKQRTRWIGTQVDHFKRFIQPDMKQLSLKRVYLHKVFQCLILPRSLYMLSFILMGIVITAAWLLDLDLVRPVALWWLGLAFTYILTLLIAVPGQFWKMETLVAILRLPVLIFSMVKALLRIKDNKKGFIHTPKGFVKNQ